MTAFVGGAARLVFTQGTTAVLGGGGSGSSRLTSTTTRLYYLVNGHAVALRQVANDGTNTVYYFQPDALGSTTLTLDASGAVAGQLRYTAYGAPLSSWGATPTSRRYTGQIADTTGLVYFQARYYDAYLARWAQPDTIVPSALHPQDLNRYGYGRNNPITYKDPSGHCIWDGCVAELALTIVILNVIAQTPQAQEFAAAAEPELAVGESELAAVASEAGPKIAQGVSDAVAPLAEAVADVGTPVLQEAGTLPQADAAAQAGAEFAPEGGLEATGNVLESEPQTVQQPSRIPASQIRFTQNSISPNTKNGVPLDTLTQEMADGAFRGSIRVVEQAGKIYSLDNRRLAAFRLLDIQAPVTFEDLSNGDVLAEFTRKLTTVTDGISIAIRGTDLTVK